MWASILTNWRLILGGVAVAMFLSLGFMVWHRGAEIESLNGQLGEARQALQTATDIANKNAAEARAIQAKADADFKILEKARVDAVKRADAARKREREILNVEPSKDGPVAPVLRDSLVRLQQAAPDRPN
jgi:hypothetical protein